MQFPLPDYGVPDNTAAFISELKTVLSRLEAGESWVVHCAAGRGRTGMAAIVLLWLAGLDPEQAQTIIERAGSGPENEEQWKFLKELFAFYGDRRP